MVYVVNTAKLSERLGDEAIGELVAWMNQVYDAKREMDALRRDMRDLLNEVREVRRRITAGGFSPPPSDPWDEGPPC